MTRVLFSSSDEAVHCIYSDTSSADPYSHIVIIPLYETACYQGVRSVSRRCNSTCRKDEVDRLGFDERIQEARSLPWEQAESGSCHLADLHSQSVLLLATEETYTYSSTILDALDTRISLIQQPSHLASRLCSQIPDSILLFRQLLKSLQPELPPPSAEPFLAFPPFPTSCWITMTVS